MLGAALLAGQPIDHHVMLVSELPAEVGAKIAEIIWESDESAVKQWSAMFQAEGVEENLVAENGRRGEGALRARSVLPLDQDEDDEHPEHVPAISQNWLSLPRLRLEQLLHVKIAGVMRQG